MTLFPCPSPSGENRLGLFLDGDGRLCDRFGRSWSSGKLAMDALPDDLREKADEREQLEKRLHAFRDDAEKLLAQCDPRWALKFHELLDRHHLSARREHEDKGPPNPRLDKIRGAAATDQAEVDTDKLAAFLSKHLSPSDVVQGIRIPTGERAGESEEDAVRAAVRKGLRKSGLDEEAVEEIAGRVLKNRREAAADYLPANALYGGQGGRLSDARKRFGANAGATNAADERLDLMFADARRLSEPTGDNYGYGSSNKRRELEEELRRQPRIAMDARAEAKDRKRFQKMFGTKRLEPRGM